MVDPDRVRRLLTLLERYRALLAEDLPDPFRRRHLVQTSAQVGAAIVLAVTTAIISAHTTAGPQSPTQMLDSYRPGLIFVTFVALAGLLVTLLHLVKRRA